MQRCTVSIDLDPIGCYYGIHGLGKPPSALRDVILRRALPRFLELFERRRIPVTFFVVGEDLETESRSGTPAGRALLKDAAKAGHELASHSHTHPYELVRLPRERVLQEVDRAHALITSVIGVPPVGFRSPGYNLSPTVIEVLLERGYRYDSSILPAPAYYAAKAAVMAAMRVVGKKSASTLGDPRFLMAPLRPYRPDAAAPWKRGDAPILEIPITVSPTLRIPVIGTYVMASPVRVRLALLESVRREPWFNFELHGIDLAGADEDGIPAELVSRQHDLRVPLVDKQRALESALDRLALDFEFLTMGDAAARHDLARN